MTSRPARFRHTAPGAASDRPTNADISLGRGLWRRSRRVLQRRGQFRYGRSGNICLLRGTAILQDQQISQWPVFSTSYGDTNSASFGGFIGYNYEWEDVITGLELNYNHFLSLSTSINGSIARSFTDSTNLPSGHHYLYDLTVKAQSAINITDIATFRARAGWEAGSFLPYAFGGLAVGRADTSTSASVSYVATDFPDVQTPPTPHLIRSVTVPEAVSIPYARNWTKRRIRIRRRDGSWRGHRTVDQPVRARRARIYLLSAG